MQNVIVVLLLTLILFSSAKIFAQSSGLYMPRDIARAYENQTRSWDGRPGKSYWQNRADYVISVEFNPRDRLLKGRETIMYFNHSPDSLKKLILHLFPNLYKKGGIRDFETEFKDHSEGVIIDSLVLNGKSINCKANNKSLQYDRTLAHLCLATPLLPDQSASLKIHWHYQLNQHSHMRTGMVDSSTFFIAYFYPRLAVYDDISGWNTMQYTGLAEFYNDFGDYEVNITVPKNFIIWATGTRENPEEVFTEKYVQRYYHALTSEAIISIIDSAESQKFKITKANPHNTWKFKATNVSDFAFAGSDHYLWDATSLVVDRETGRRIVIDAAYHKESKDFYHVTRIARQAIHLMSTQIPGIPWPYPKMTVFNGLDEMEYPMMVNDISYADINETTKLTIHEILHTYLPFYLGINESKYAWMDEGYTSFGDYLIFSQMISPELARFYYLDAYREEAGHAPDTPIFVISEFLKRPVYHYNSYAKTAAFFLILRDLLGEENFNRTWHEFMERWKGKHPTPYDLFFTFNEVSGQNLDWLFKTWFFEFGYVDLAIKEVRSEATKVKISIEKKGPYPAPIELIVQFKDGSEEHFFQKASVWKSAKPTFEVAISYKQAIKRLELKDLTLIDADLSNNLLILSQ